MNRLELKGGVNLAFDFDDSVSDLQSAKYPVPPSKYSQVKSRMEYKK